MRLTAALAKEAAEVFDLDLEEATNEVVTAAYRKAAKTCHPDSSAYDPARWQRISWAKSTLEAWSTAVKKANAPQPGGKGNCRACGGSGRIQRRVGFGVGPVMVCVLCHGTGNVKGHDREE